MNNNELITRENAMNMQSDPIEYPKCWLDQGMEAQQKKNLAVAISCYDAVTSSEFVDPALFMGACERRAKCYYEKRCYDSAIEDYNQVVERMPHHPDYADVYVNRGLAYCAKGDFDLGIEDLTSAVQLRPGYAIAQRFRGVIYYHKGEIVRAIDDFTAVIQQYLNHPKAYYNRGIAWLHLREWEKAKSDLTFAGSRGKVISTVFHDDFGSVADFQRKRGINIPADIVSMLTDF